MSRETFQSLRMLLMEKLDLARELTDEEILEEIDTLILERMRDSCLSLKEKVQLRQELFHSVRKLDVLQELIEDETVTEIMVNGPDAIFVERAGKLSRWEKTFTSGEKLEDVIQQIVGKCNRVVNESMPIVDARLENGARVNAVVRPVALNGPILTIRRFPDTPITMEKLIALGSLPAECAEFLKTLVRARYSMVIGGGTGSGKTTFAENYREVAEKEKALLTYGQKDPVSQGYNDACTAFARGASAMFTIGSYAISQIKSVNPDMNIGSFVFPANEDADKNVLNSGNDLMFCVMKDCKNKEAAYEVLSYMLEDENVKKYLNAQSAVPCKKGDFEITPELEEMRDYIENGIVADYQDHHYPSEMSVDAMIQTYLMDDSADATDTFMKRFDKEWIRYNRDVVAKVKAYEEGNDHE